MVKSEQRFTYIVQILNEEVGADYLEWLSAFLLPDQPFTGSLVGEVGLISPNNEETKNNPQNTDEHLQ